MANKVKYGLSNVHYAVIEDDGTYGAVAEIKGAVNLSLEASGDTSDFYADNTVFFTTAQNNGYEGDLEIALIPDDFLVSVMGFELDSNGAIVESADAKPEHFALGFEIQGDEKNRRTWLYDCIATRPSDSAQTSESSIEPTTDSLTLKAIPRSKDKKVKAVMTETVENTSAFASFFESVYESPAGA